MILWIVSVTLGAVVAWITYTGASRDDSPAAAGRVSPRTLGLATLRALATALLAAAALGAPLASGTNLAPALAVDVSLSVTRTHDQPESERALRARVSDLMRTLGSEQLFTFGDTLREVDASSVEGLIWREQASRLRPIIDKTASLGLAVVILTDGEISDPDSFRDALPGSRVVGDSLVEREDVALLSIDVPRSAVAGDTIVAEVSVAAGRSGSPGGELKLWAGVREAATVRLPGLAAGAVARIPMRFVVPTGQGPLPMRAIVEATSDYEVRNDTTGTILEVSDRPAAVLVSTAPDMDVREVLRVLRGTLDLDVRGYLRLAPGMWREEGTLTPVAESEVEARARRAGFLVLHGDTTWHGVTRSFHGARALWAPAALAGAPRAGEFRTEPEWFPASAPFSPVSAVLSALPWDSLPPFRLSAPAVGAHTFLEARLSRGGTPVPFIAGTEEGRTRRLVISGSGFASWALRGGRSAELFTALWGSVFDWLAAARSDERAIVPAKPDFREGEPIRWRRTGPDSMVSLLITRGNTLVDSIAVSFSGESDVVTGKPLPRGIYTVRSKGDSSMFVVNVSEELLPSEVTLPSGSSVEGKLRSGTPRVADRGWPFVAALLLLAVEWLLRRYAGLR